MLPENLTATPCTCTRCKIYSRLPRRPSYIYVSIPQGQGQLQRYPGLLLIFHTSRLPTTHNYPTFENILLIPSHNVYIYHPHPQCHLKPAISYDLWWEWEPTTLKPVRLLIVFPQNMADIDQDLLDDSSNCQNKCTKVVNMFLHSSG